jgi:adenylate cyclase class IV
MQKSMEVEVRGPLDAEKWSTLQSILARDAEHVGDYKRLLIDYSTLIEGIGSRKLDIRARITNDEPELIVKVGEWAGGGREEVEVRLGKGEFRKALRFMSLLGYKKGVAAVRMMKRYNYLGTEITLTEVVKIDKDLKETSGYGYFYEVEVVADSQHEEEAMNKVLAVIKGLGLRVFKEYGEKIPCVAQEGVLVAEESFYSLIEKLNKEANIVIDTDETELDGLIQGLR